MKKLYRSRTDRKLTGLCGGVSVYANLDPNVVRLLAIVLIVMSGVLPGIAAYVIASIIIPEEGETNAQA